MRDRTETNSAQDNGRFYYVQKEGEQVEFDVRITETRQKTVSVEAGSMAEAKKIAQELYADKVFDLDTTRLKKVGFETLYPDCDRPLCR